MSPYRTPVYPSGISSRAASSSAVLVELRRRLPDTNSMRSTCPCSPRTTARAAYRGRRRRSRIGRSEMGSAHADVDELFGRVSARLVTKHPGLERGKIMRSTGLKTGGRFCAFVARGELVVKLPADRVAELIAAG